MPPVYKDEVTHHDDSRAVASFADGGPQDPVINWISRHAPMEQPSSRKIPQHVVPLAFGWQDVKIVSTLGKGSFGRVFLAKVNYTLVAVKVLVDTQRLGLVAPFSSYNSQALALTNDSSAASTSQKALVKVSYNFAQVHSFQGFKVYVYKAGSEYFHLIFTSKCCVCLCRRSASWHFYATLTWHCSLASA